MCAIVQMRSFVQVLAQVHRYVQLIAQVQLQCASTCASICANICVSAQVLAQALLAQVLSQVCKCLRKYLHKCATSLLAHIETFKILHYKIKITVAIPANTKRQSNLFLLLGQRRRQ